MAEQTALLKKAESSIESAKLLTANGFHDFAVSRAYYAMFYLAEAFLLGEGVSFSKHSGVISAFGQRFAKTGRVPVDFHRYLIEGQESRTVGDYDTGMSLSNVDADEQIKRAEKFLELAKQLIQ